MKWIVVVNVGYCKFEVAFDSCEEAGEFAKTMLMRGMSDKEISVIINIQEN